MSLQIITASDRRAISLIGDLDVYSLDSGTLAKLRAAVMESPAIHLELEGVTRCDAAGIQCLLAAAKSARTAGKSFGLSMSAAVDQCRLLLGLKPEFWTPPAI